MQKYPKSTSNIDIFYLITTKEQIIPTNFSLIENKIVTLCWKREQEWS